MVSGVARWSRVAVAAAVLGCGRPPPATTPAQDLDLDLGQRAAPASERWYQLAWRGATVGWAVERVHRDEAGVTVERTEHLRLRRGEAVVEEHTTIVAHATPALVPTRVTVTTGLGDGGERVRVARRDDAGWRVDGEAVAVPAAAIPVELVPLRVARDGGFAGPVLMAGRGFAVGDGEVVALGPRQQRARTRLPGAVREAAIELDDDGGAGLVVDGTGVVATRTSQLLAQALGAPIDVLALGALAVVVRRHVAVELTAGPPPAAPGQRAVPIATGWRLEVAPDEPGGLPAPTAGAAGDRSAAIAAVVAAVAAAIEPSLLERGPDRGDCTTYALAVAAAAASARIPAKVVTGYRLDGALLVRHRWNLAWTGDRWLPVDASTDAAPARDPRLALAVHDATTASLAAAELAFTGVSAATAP
ncbi:MAG: transglutaminase domain-containing protein [Kofleriaceae bacterium]